MNNYLALEWQSRMIDTWMYNTDGSVNYAGGPIGNNQNADSVGAYLYFSPLKNIVDA